MSARETSAMGTGTNQILKFLVYIIASGDTPGQACHSTLNKQKPGERESRS